MRKSSLYNHKVMGSCHLTDNSIKNILISDKKHLLVSEQKNKLIENVL